MWNAVQLSTYGIKVISIHMFDCYVDVLLNKYLSLFLSEVWLSISNQDYCMGEYEQKEFYKKYNKKNM